MHQLVSTECTRYQRHLIQPDMSNMYELSMVLMNVTIWPAEEKVQLVDVVMKQEEMEKLVEL